MNLVGNEMTCIGWVPGLEHGSIEIEQNGRSDRLLRGQSLERVLGLADIIEGECHRRVRADAPSNHLVGPNQILLELIETREDDCEESGGQSDRGRERNDHHQLVPDGKPCEQSSEELADRSDEPVHGRTVLRGASGRATKLMTCRDGASVSKPMT